MAKILFFSPHAAIWPHAFAEAQIATSLKSQGHEVVWAGCNGLLGRHCSAMMASGITAGDSELKKQLICRSCRANRNAIVETQGFRSLRLDSFVTEDERASCQKIANAVTRESYLEFQAHGLPLGKIALYEVLLQHKKSDLNFDETEWSEVRTAIYNTLLAATAAERLLATEKPDFLVSYNSLYTVHSVASKLAEARGIPAYFMHGGLHMRDRTRTLMLGRHSTVFFLKNLITRHWLRFRDVPCKPEELKLVTDHFLELLRGKSVFVYSAPKSAGSESRIRERYGIGPKQRLLVAAMSSYDERFSSETVGAFKRPERLVFPTQLEWIRSLIAYVQERPELFLLVRVHPREFPNKRESILSEHARQLMEAFRELPPNVKINWPQDEVSLYDLAQDTELFLSAWSSVGSEMALLGIPVLIYSPEMVWYPPELNFVGTDRESYFHKIGEALASGWSLERIRATYRWYTLCFQRAQLRLGVDAAQALPLESLPRPLRKALRVLVPGVRERRLLKEGFNMPEEAEQLSELLKKSADSILDLPGGPQEPSPEALAVETRALRQELARLSAALLAGQSSGLLANLFQAAEPLDPLSAPS